jgi:hypothetical protein
MPEVKDYRPRLTIDITYEQKKLLGELIPWGTQTKLFAVIVDDLISVLQKHGTLALASILTSQLRVTDYSPTMRDAANGDHTKS